MGYEIELFEVRSPATGKTFRIYEDESGNIQTRVGGTYVTEGQPLAAFSTDDSGNVTGLIGPDGVPIVKLPDVGTAFSTPVRISGTGVLIGLPSSGSVGNNGSVTGLTSMPVALGPCYLYFPAGALYAGSVAGFYYSVITSTTTATVYSEMWNGGIPELPESPTPLVSVGPGAYTQTTGVDITVASCIVPGGLLGKHGALFIYPSIVENSSANNKGWLAKLANTTVIGRTNTTSVVDHTPVIVRNCGAEDRQVSTSYVGFVPNSGGLMIRTAVDTSVDTELIIQLKMNVDTDYLFLNGYEVIASF